MGIYKIKNIGHLSKDKSTILRDSYDPERYAELHKSLRVNGYLPEHPMIVTLGGIILDGNTRYDICKELSINEIPVVEVSGKNEMIALQKQLIGILLKKDLEPIEKAKALKRYVDLRVKKDKIEFSHAKIEKINEILKPLGISYTRYCNISKVLDKGDVKEAIENDEISFRKGEEIARVKDDDKRKELIDEIKKDPKKVEEIRELVEEVNEIKDTPEISDEESVGFESKPEVTEAPIQHDETPKPPKKPENEELTPRQEKKAFDDFKKILKMKRLPKLDKLPELGKSSQYGNTLEVMLRLSTVLKDHNNNFEAHTKKRFRDRIEDIKENLILIEEVLRG
jgi:ParB-like chromosome segregation protein Spo0J